jgi:hypothetical protein
MKKFVVIIALLALVVSSGVFAEPTTQKVKITSLRPYASDNSGTCKWIGLRQSVRMKEELMCF